MKQLKTLWATLTKLSQSNRRECFIIATVLTGMFFPWLLWSNDKILIKTIASWFDYYNSYYYTNYTISFLRSALFSVLVIFAIKSTESNRLIGLLIIAVTSMMFDLGSVMSPSIHNMVRAFRYDWAYNFKDLYTAYEIFCITYIGIDYIVSRIVNKFNNSNSFSNHGINHSKINKSNHDNHGHKS